MMAWHIYVSGLQQKHQQDLSNLNLIAQPSKTLKLFGFAVIQRLRHLLSYVVGKSGLLVFSTSIILVLCLLAVKAGKHGEKVVYFFLNR